MNRSEHSEHIVLGRIAYAPSARDEPAARATTGATMNQRCPRGSPRRPAERWPTKRRRIAELMAKIKAVMAGGL
jgi:hypothetical protein